MLAGSDQLQIVHPGHLAVEPPCPSFGACGGCASQSTKYELQLLAKAAKVRMALEGAGVACAVQSPLASHASGTVSSQDAQQVNERAECSNPAASDPAQTSAGLEIEDALYQMQTKDQPLLLLHPLASPRQMHYRNKADFSISAEPWVSKPPRSPARGTGPARGGSDIAAGDSRDTANSVGRIGGDSSTSGNDSRGTQSGAADVRAPKQGTGPALGYMPWSHGDVFLPKVLEPEKCTLLDPRASVALGMVRDALRGTRVGPSSSDAVRKSAARNRKRKARGQAKAAAASRSSEESASGGSNASGEAIESSDNLDLIQSVEIRVMHSPDVTEAGFLSGSADRARAHAPTRKVLPMAAIGDSTVHEASMPAGGSSAPGSMVHAWHATHAVHKGKIREVFNTGNSSGTSAAAATDGTIDAESLSEHARYIPLQHDPGAEEVWKAKISRDIKDVANAALVELGPPSTRSDLVESDGMERSSAARSNQTKQLRPDTLSEHAEDSALEVIIWLHGRSFLRFQRETDLEERLVKPLLARFGASGRQQQSASGTGSAEPRSRGFRNIFVRVGWKPRSIPKETENAFRRQMEEMFPVPDGEQCELLVAPAPVTAPVSNAEIIQANMIGWRREYLQGIIKSVSGSSLGCMRQVVGAWDVEQVSGAVHARAGRSPAAPTSGFSIKASRAPLVLDAPAGCFSQVNSLGASVLSREVVASLAWHWDTRGRLHSALQQHPEAPASGSSGGDAPLVVDLFCGTGLFSHQVARAFPSAKVLGLELETESVRAFDRVAERNGDSERMVARQLDLRSEQVPLVIARMMEMQGEHEAGALLRPFAVVVNPPRAGLTESARDWLLRSRADVVVYVSCEPSTLARDLSVLGKGPDDGGSGFRAMCTRPVDMFPMTPHVESVTVLTRELS